MMPPSPVIALPAPRFLQRRTIIAACLLVALLTIIALAGVAAPEVIYRLLTDGLLLLAWLAAAGGIGSLFLRFNGGGCTLKLVTAVALGLGILGLATLLLGLVGGLNRPVAFALIGVGVVLGMMKLMRAGLTSERIGEWLAAPAPWAWLWLAAAPVFGLAILAALAPPGILWGDEPHAYDVLEYHLQIPREWHEAGKIQRLDHNAFSYFPQGVEVHYLLAMHLRGGPWQGMYLAQLMHAAMTLLSAAAVFGVALTVATRRQASIAAVAALTVPWIALLAPMAYNEGGLLLYGTLAIGWTLHTIRRTRPEDRRWHDVLLAAVFAGLACGTKLTAGPLLLLGLPLAGFAAGLDWKRAITIAALGFVVFSPWAIRTFVWSGGNPVFPEANNVFKSDRFTTTQNERWKRAHTPPAEQRSIVARLRAAVAQILRDWRFGYLLIPLAVIAAVLTRYRTETRFLAALLVIQIIFWLGFTHLQGRFFVLAIPTAALLLLQLERRAHLRIGAAAVVVQALLTIALVASHPRFQLAGAVGLFGLERIEAMLPQDMQDALASGAPVELVGDAQAFRYPIPMSRLRYRTVFDINNEKSDQEIVEAWLGSKRREGAYLFIDPPELRRLSNTYVGVPGRDFPGTEPLVIPPGSPDPR
ncbi:MAG: hypothetical protein QOE14_301 [Humisphaera sp.]|nr:hypothetical protein [Humisphaera sp.]